MARLCSFICILVLYAVLFIPTSCLGNGHFRQQEKPPAFFIFGDSALDPGNNNYVNVTMVSRANFWPNGETFFKYPTGQFSNGRLVSDFIVEFANIPLIPPFLEPGAQFTYGANFASAGGGALVETFRGLVIDLQTQLNSFKKLETSMRYKLGDVEANKTISKAVYLIGIIGNDYTNLFLTNSTLLYTYSQLEFVGMVIGNLTTVIQEIYKSGGRKFGILSMGTLGCLPGMRAFKPENNGGCLEEANTFAKLHNKALSKVLKGLEQHLQGFRYSNFKLYRSFSQIMNHPSKYGFKEGKTACCGSGPFRGVFNCGGRGTVKEYELCENPSEYVWWDAYHPTERVYQQLAEQMWSGTPDVVGPYNLKDLFNSVDE